MYNGPQVVFGEACDYEPECLRSPEPAAPSEKGLAVNYGRRGRQTTKEMWQRVSFSTDLDCSKWRSCARRHPSSHLHARSLNTGTHQRLVQRVRRNLRARPTTTTATAATATTINSGDSDNASRAPKRAPPDPRINSRDGT